MDRGPRVAAAALAAAPWADVPTLLQRPNDPPAARAYYATTSTCALSVLTWWRLAGMDEPEVTDAYFPGRVGQAFANVLAVARRFGAWVPTVPGVAPVLEAGDAWIITDDKGGDGHMGIVTARQVFVGDPLATVEGGQGPTGLQIGAFSRHLAPSGGKWAMGSRFLLGVVRAANLPIPDSNDP